MLTIFADDDALFNVFDFQPFDDAGNSFALASMTSLGVPCKCISLRFLPLYIPGTKAVTHQPFLIVGWKH